MSIRYTNLGRQQSRQQFDEEALKEQVLEKVTTGLVVATIISLFITQVPVPTFVYFIAVGLEFAIILGYIFAKNESTIEKLYYGFVVTTAITLGFLLNIALATQGGMVLIATAFGTTSMIVGGIYYYTSVNKPDTSNMIKYLFPALLVFFLIAIIGFFVAYGRIFNLIFSIAGAILFSFYLYYDMGRLMNQQYMSPSRMAFQIYWDIILIFKFILRALLFSRD